MLSPLLLLLTQSALAIPTQMTHQGRLLDSDGAGLTGEHELIFRIMDDPEDGYALWTETLTVSFTNGYYAIILGSDEVNNPDDNIFANDPLYLALKVDGGDLEPRHPLTSVPYAQIAGVAERVDGGVVNASEMLVPSRSSTAPGIGWVQPRRGLADLDAVPADLADGDDDTQLDQAGVLGYVTGQTVDLGAGSTIDGSSIVTAADYQSYLPADLADGDTDSLASTVCAVGEMGCASGWTCVSVPR